MNHTNTEKAEYWSTHLSEWRNSGISQNRYCQRQGLSLAAFYYWKKRISEQGQSGFVKIKEEIPPEIIRLILPGGIKILFDTKTRIKDITTYMENLCASIGMK